MHELLEVNFAVTVLIDFLDRSFQLLFSVNVFEFFSGEERSDLSCVNLARIVLVEHFKCTTQVLFLKESLRAHGCSQEFYEKLNGK